MELDETVHLTNVWINALHEKTGWEDKHRTYRLLRATLHAIRDHLPVSEIADLGAQMPMLLRGLYYEGWRPAHTPSHDRSKAGFLDHVQQRFQRDPLANPEDAVGAVFAILDEKISAGEVAHVRQALPKHIRELFAH